jgi:hypothetical protein
MQGFSVFFPTFSVLNIGFNWGCGESIAILFDRMNAVGIWG